MLTITLFSSTENSTSLTNLLTWPLNLGDVQSVFWLSVDGILQGSELLQFVWGNDVFQVSQPMIPRGPNDLESMRVY